MTTPNDAETERAVMLARELAIVPMPSAASREEMRTAILAAAARVDSEPRATAPRPSRWRYAIAAAIACAAAIAIVIAIPRSEDAHRGTVHASANARFSSSALPDEVVRLEDGSLAIEVDPLHAGERYRVVVGDGEVEVRGTAFTVDATHDRLLAVRVAHGRVEVRPFGAPTVVLGAGESWQRALTATTAGTEARPTAEAGTTAAVPVIDDGVARSQSARASVPAVGRASVPAAVARASVPAAVAPASVPAAALSELQRDRHGAAPPAIVAAPRAADAIAFDDAWDAMRAGRFAAAAVAFARVVAIAPTGGLADDARFWAAVGHSRANDRAAAIEAFRDLLDHHARSAHADEASVMLGWLLVETGALDEARRRFTIGLTATTAEVRDSARAGLDAL